MEGRKVIIDVSLPIVALFVLMHSEAIGLIGTTSSIRAVLVAFLIALAGVSMLAGRYKLPGGGWLLWSIVAFSVWVSTRVVIETEVSINALVNTLWFPIFFLVGLLSSHQSRRSLTLFTYYAIFTSLTYTWVALETGMRGPQAINAIYYSVLALPFVLARGRGPLTYLAVIALAVATMSSEKRGAATALILALLFALLIVLWARRRGRIRPSAVLGVIVAGMIAALSYAGIVGRYRIDIIERFAGLSDDGGSGRELILRSVAQRIDNLPVPDLLVGNGYNAVAKTIGVSAHNDFLEVTFDFGLIGLLLFCSIAFSSIAAAVKSVRVDIRSGIGMAAATTLFIALAMLSHIVFIPTYVGLIAYFWGSTIRSNEAKNASNLFRPLNANGTNGRVQIND